jgi:DNA-binding Lrp family transcriptional regulator
MKKEVENLFYLRTPCNNWWRLLRAYMGLTCKCGYYNEVIEKLTEMDIPTGDIFLLYGPVDVLVRFDGFNSIEEFVKKWFNPVRMIGADQKLIAKTTTYIVVIEGPKFMEQPFAFMFLNVQPRDAESAQQKLINLPQVISADFVFGPCDLIVPVRAQSNIDLEKVVRRIDAEVSGIEEAQTTVVAMMQI